MLIRTGLLLFACVWSGGGIILDGTRSSYAVYGGWNACRNSTLSLDFNTRYQNGLLVYQDDGGEEDFLEIKLVKSRVRVRLKMSADSVIRFDIGDRLDDRQWHNLKLIRSGGRTIVKVSSSYKTQATNVSDWQFGDGSSELRLYVGGLSPEKAEAVDLVTLPGVIHEPRFAGGVRNVEFHSCDGTRVVHPDILDSAGINTKWQSVCLTDNPCYYGSICLETDAGPVCDCSGLPYQGIYCSMPRKPLEATFRGDAYLSYNFSGRGDSTTDTDELRFSFKTYQPNAQIVHSGSKDNYLNVALLGGKLFVLVTLPDGSPVSTNLGKVESPFNDNEWHDVSVKRTVTEIEVVAGKIPWVHSVTRSFNFLSSESFFIGGQNEGHSLGGGLVNSDFVGCLRNVVHKMGSQTIDVLEVANSSTYYTPGGTVPTNIEFGKCKPIYASVPLTFLTPESYVTLASWQARPKGTLSFRFQTTEQYGLLFYNGDNRGGSDLIAMELVEGELVLIVDYGDGSGTRRFVVEAGVNVTNGYEHFVMVFVNGQRISVKVDSRFGLNETIPTSPRSFLDLSDSLHVGGIDFRSHSFSPSVWTASLKRGYVGCLSQFKVNGRQLDLHEVADDQDVKVGKYCQAEAGGPKCQSNPCRNGAPCTGGWNRYTCDCSTIPHVGLDCVQAAPYLMFDGSHIAKFNFRKPLSSEAESISFRFRTARPNGLLFMMREGDKEPSLKVKLYMNKLSVTVHPDDDRGRMHFFGEDLGNDVWHSFQMLRLRNDLHITLDGKHVRRGNAFQDSTTYLSTHVSVGGSFDIIGNRHILTTGHFTFGPEDWGKLKHQDTFVGFIGNLVFNSINLLDPSATSYYGISTEIAASVDTPTIPPINPVTFASPSHFVAAQRMNIQYGFSVHFLFRTAATRGLILYHSDRSQRSYIAVEIKGRRLHYAFQMLEGSQIDLWSHKVTEVEGGDSEGLSDKQWHAVRIVRKPDCRHQLFVDGELQGEKAPIDCIQRNINFYDSLMIGGLPQDNFTNLPTGVHSKQGYKGCLASVDINGDRPNLKTDTAVHNTFLHNGCVDIKECQSGACKNGGECVSKAPDFTCDCSLTSFTGTRCNTRSVAFNFGMEDDQPGAVVYTSPSLSGRPLDSRVDRLAFGFMMPSALHSDTDASPSRILLVRINSRNTNDIIEFRLEKQCLLVKYKIGLGWYSFSSSTLAVDEYHVVRFIRRGMNASLQIDDQDPVHRHPKNEQTAVFNSLDKIMIGALVNLFSERLTNGFRGVISGFSFNDIRPFDLAANGSDLVKTFGSVTRKSPKKSRAEIRSTQIHPLLSTVPAVDTDDLVVLTTGGPCKDYLCESVPSPKKSGEEGGFGASMITTRLTWTGAQRMVTKTSTTTAAIISNSKELERAGVPKRNGIADKKDSDSNPTIRHHGDSSGTGSNTSDDQSDLFGLKDNIPVIAGICGAAVVSIVLTILIAYKLTRRNRSSKEKAPLPPAGKTKMNGSTYDSDLKNDVNGKRSTAHPPHFHGTNEPPPKNVKEWYV